MSNKLTLQHIHFDSVTHEVKVTRIPGRGYGVRVFTNGVLNQEGLAETRMDIGRVARGLLRMEDKCGNISNYADRARFRQGEKENKHREAQKAQEDQAGQLPQQGDPAPGA